MTWTQAYAEGLAHGISMYQENLIVPDDNVFYYIKDDGLYGKWGHIANQLIFVWGNNTKSDVAIFGFDFSGHLRWLAQTAPLTPWTKDAPLTFSPERFELTKDALLIHGFYHHSVGEKNWRPWTIRLPLAELAALEKH